MNTLHRISESLQSVEVFRKLYAKTQEEGQKATVAVEGAGQQAPSRAIRPTGSWPNLWQLITEALERLRSTWERSILGCVKQIRGPIQLLWRMLGFERSSQDGKSATRSEL